MKHLREGKELKELQKMVDSTVRPRHCGRPPAGLGTSEAGSLTSDPLRSLVTIDLPLAIPILWDMADPNSADQQARELWAKLKEEEEAKKEARKRNKATREAAKAKQNAQANLQAAARPQKRRRYNQPESSKAKGKRRFNESSSDSDSIHSDARVIKKAAQTEEPDAEQLSSLSWRLIDDKGILLLASAIKHLCARTVSREDIRLGQEKLLAYLTQTAQLRGAKRMRPNHHFATHLAEQIIRYGPMSQIWTYSGERLNYELKNTSSNRHGGGERELTFARTFHEHCACVTRLSNMANDEKDALAEWAKYLLQINYASSRGTADTETMDTYDATETPMTNRKPTRLQLPEVETLYEAFKRAQPNVPIRRALYERGNAPVLEQEVYPIRDVRLKGRVFSMSSFQDSIVKASVVENGELVERVGTSGKTWIIR
ncbi:hypothetical protein FRC12_021030 [Ceratobasidium sp. 428]|nr:hypothetical protein FRC12_021030 [Ceratobasidium sp. 428]